MSDESDDVAKPPQVADVPNLNIWLNAFANLLETLNRASNEGQADQRGRYIIELTALATFIGTFGRPIGAHIYELASKLGNLDKGHPDPLFEPAKVWDRRPDVSSRWRARDALCWQLRR
jgi:hypothetical protein